MDTNSYYLLFVNFDIIVEELPQHQQLITFTNILFPESLICLQPVH